MTFVAVPGGFAGAPWLSTVDRPLSLVEVLGTADVVLADTGSPPTGLRVLAALAVTEDTLGGLALRARADGSQGQGQAWLRWDKRVGDAALGVLAAVEQRAGASGPGLALTLRGQLGPWALDAGIGGTTGAVRPDLQVVLGHRTIAGVAEWRHETWARRQADAPGLLAGGRSGLSWQLGPGPRIGLSVGISGSVDAPSPWYVQPALSLTW
ncbi:MAG: hypothetical protein VKO64_05095 [Candidatus Sericytochromatia bacterium]|nr:hypothetical protein [Candidatus Sericytochromatia bacterium]